MRALQLNWLHRRPGSVGCKSESVSAPWRVNSGENGGPVCRWHAGGVGWNSSFRFSLPLRVSPDGFSEVPLVTRLGLPVPDAQPHEEPGASLPLNLLYLACYIPSG